MQLRVRAACLDTLVVRPLHIGASTTLSPASTAASCLLYSCMYTGTNPPHDVYCNLSRTQPVAALIVAMPRSVAVPVALRQPSNQSSNELLGSFAARHKMRATPCFMYQRKKPIEDRPTGSHFDAGHSRFHRPGSASIKDSRGPTIRCSR